MEQISKINQSILYTHTHTLIRVTTLAYIMSHKVYIQDAKCIKYNCMQIKSSELQKQY